jgi:hypothetical protein
MQRPLTMGMLIGTLTNVTVKMVFLPLAAQTSAKTEIGRTFRLAATRLRETGAWARFVNDLKAMLTPAGAG